MVIYFVIFILKNMEKKHIKISNAKTYFDNRFKCENLSWKPMDERTKVAWCKACDGSCSFNKCPKVNNNK